MLPAMGLERLLDQSVSDTQSMHSLVKNCGDEGLDFYYKQGLDPGEQVLTNEQT